jgi:hypothetical protein
MGFHPITREAMEKDDPGTLAGTSGRPMQHAAQQFAPRIGKLDKKFHELLWLARRVFSFPGQQLLPQALFAISCGSAPVNVK